MSLRDRKKPAGRRPIPGFDSLEGRQMLTASSLNHLVVPAVHFDFSPKTNHAVAAATKHVAAASTQATQHVATTAKHATKQEIAAEEKAAKKYGVATNNIVPKFYVAPPGTNAAPVTTVPAGAFTPALVTTAYGVNQLGAANQGQGTTIAIIDVYNDPTILNDANTFSTAFNLPQFTTATLKVVKDTYFGSVANAPLNPNAQGYGVDVETSLDVEWAHALAPKANILLVEVPSFSFPSLLHGIQYAATQPGVDVVSVSYGGYDALNSGGAAYYGALAKAYLSTGPSFNVAVTVSTGDQEYPGFPATSPNVIAVGGTSLFTSPTGVYTKETSWGGQQTGGSGGGGYSGSFAPPLFQSSHGVNFPTRTIPDVAAIADPATGVAIYDSYGTLAYETGEPTGSTWAIEGGTSLAAPVTAAMIDLAQQDRAAANKPILNSTQINNLLYQTSLSPTDYAKYFNDVTQGSTNAYGYTFNFATFQYVYGLVQAGYVAKPGYDFATGLGSFKANNIVPYLTTA